MNTTNVDSSNYDLLDQEAKYNRERDYLYTAIPGIDNAKEPQIVEAKDMTEVIFKKEWVNNNHTCLIKGAINHWPAMKNWRDKEYWLKTSNRKEVTLYRNNGHELDEKYLKGHLRINFHEAINRLYDNVDYAVYLPANIPEAFKDIAGFHFLPSPPKPNNYEPITLLIQRRTFTTWHAHPYDEFLLSQVMGSKKVILFPPNIPEDKNYVCDFLRDELYLEGKSLNKKLNYNPIIAELKEGDALYIPPYWHQAIHTLGAGINFSVIYRWGSPLHKMGNFNSRFVIDNYKDLLWPVNKYTPIVPLIAGSCFTSYIFKRMTGQISGQYI